jgi:MoaA/NifB/PqqE/SkfB family radical SAM enzyme
MANIWYIQVNRFCNNKCHFCSNPSTWENISFKRWRELIDDFKKRKYKWIILTGWEPTLSSDLARWIEYSVSIWMDCRIISNWMQCSNLDYIKSLKQAWLSLVHFSLYSYIEKVHDFLTDTPWSYKKLLQAIQNTIKLWIIVQLNCVINKYNQTHLDKTVKFILKNFPQIRHFVWNNLDPEMMRKTNIAQSTLPDFDIAWENIKKALFVLEKTWRTFRVERFPLCFMRWFEFASTETRKIVKNEERIVHFLDFRKTLIQKAWYWEHDKLEECKDCDLNSICAWIYEYKKYYNYVKVTPQKMSVEEKESIIKKIKA